MEVSEMSEQQLLYDPDDFIQVLCFIYAQISHGNMGLFQDRLILAYASQQVKEQYESLQGSNRPVTLHVH